jgi:hypothetical protein
MTPSAVWPGIALGVIDRGPAANGVDRSTRYDTPRLKLPAIGIIIPEIDCQSFESPPAIVIQFLRIFLISTYLWADRT